VDPIEKKPFYHYLPTATAFSLATAGCNLRCKYCQNWTISQVPPEETRNADLPPADVVRYAREQGAPVIAYTYSEPIIFYEYMFDTARLAQQAGLRNVVISAGFINAEPLLALCEVVDAIKIDLKGYDTTFYREVCGGELQPILETIATIYQSKTHLEIVNLVVPTLNDDLDQLRALACWIVKELGPDVPLHFSRFYPQYKLKNLPPTPVETLEQARQTALDEGVHFVYIGNVGGHPGNHTYCPACGEIVIERVGFGVKGYHIESDCCAFCGASIPGVWWPNQPPSGSGQPPEAPRQ
jgi:pyruvate formate lyase activating enzyme